MAEESRDGEREGTDQEYSVYADSQRAEDRHRGRSVNQ